MADETEYRYLVEWTEAVTHNDVVYVSEEAARVGLEYSEETWQGFDPASRQAMIRYWINMQGGIEELHGTHRMRVANRFGFDVTGSAPWPDDAEEPKL